MRGIMMRAKVCGSLRAAWAFLEDYLRRIRIGTRDEAPMPPDGRGLQHTSRLGPPAGGDVILGATPGGIRYEIRYTPSALAGLLASDIHAIGRTIDGMCAFESPAGLDRRAAIVTEPGRRDRPLLCLVLADQLGQPLRLIAMGLDDRASWPQPSGRRQRLVEPRGKEGTDFPGTG